MQLPAVYHFEAAAAVDCPLAHSFLQLLPVFLCIADKHFPAAFEREIQLRGKLIHDSVPPGAASGFEAACRIRETAVNYCGVTAARLIADIGVLFEHGDVQNLA